MSDPIARAEIQAEIEFNQAQLQANATVAARRVAGIFEQTVNRARLNPTVNTSQIDQAVNRSATNIRTAFGNAFRQAASETKNLEKGLITVAIAAQTLGQSITRGITRPLSKVFKEGITASSDLTEALNLTSVSFGEQADEAVRWAEELDDSFGLTVKNALEARGNFQLFFTELGLGLRESTQLSRELTERIGDIASLRNVPVPDVIRRIQSGLVGETEAVRRLGIVLDESVVKRRAVTEGIIEEGEALTAEQKIQVRATEILRQSSEAAGDAANTVNTFAGQLRVFNVTRDEFVRGLTEAFLPVAQRVLTVVNGMLRAFSELPAPIRTVAATALIAAAALGPLLVVFGQMASSILLVRAAAGVLTPFLRIFATVLPGIVSSFGGLGAVLASIGAGPIAAAVAATVLLVAVLIRAWQRSEQLREAFGALINQIKQIFEPLGGLENVLPAIIDFFSDLVNIIADLATPVLVVTLRTWQLAFFGVEQVVRFLVAAFELAVGVLQRLIDRFNSIPGPLQSLISLVVRGTSAFTEFSNAASSAMSPAFVNQVRTLSRAFADANPSISEINGSFKSLNEILTDLVGKQQELIALQDKVTSATDRLRDAQSKLQDALQGVVDAQQKVVDAEENLGDARERLIESTDRIQDLEVKRLEIISDTARDTEELAEAEDDLARIRFRLIDLAEREAEILERINELRQPATARELAQADRDIERAKLALNRAIREEQELLAELNQEQRQTVDLTGLSLDQLRTKLANIRASLAAQRSVNRTSRTAEEIEADQVEARLSVLDAQERLNQALEEKDKLDNRAINNADEIVGLERDLAELAITRRGLLRDQVEAQQALNNLRAGETERAKEIKAIDDQITTAKKSQESATRAVLDAERGIAEAARGVFNAELAVFNAKNAIHQAEINVLNAKRDQRFESTLILGTEQEINAVLRDRLGINNQLLGQNIDLVARQIESIFADSPLLPFVQGNPAFARQVADLLLNNPNKLRELFRTLGVSGFAQGGMITQPTLARMGEFRKPEMVLPLTKPDRVWSLLSQNLPRFPDALRAVQSAVAPAAVRPKVSVPASFRAPLRRADGPMTYAQAEQIIQLLHENGKMNLTVEAPIQVTTPVQDPEHLARSIERRIERTIREKLR